MGTVDWQKTGAARDRGRGLPAYAHKR